MPRRRKRHRSGIRARDRRGGQRVCHGHDRVQGFSDAQRASARAWRHQDRHRRVRQRDPAGRLGLRVLHVSRRRQLRRGARHRGRREAERLRHGPDGLGELSRPPGVPAAAARRHRRVHHEDRSTRIDRLVHVFRRRRRPERRPAVLPRRRRDGPGRRRRSARQRLCGRAHQFDRSAGAERGAALSRRRAVDALFVHQRRVRGQPRRRRDAVVRDLRGRTATCRPSRSTPPTHE